MVWWNVWGGNNDFINNSVTSTVLFPTPFDGVAMQLKKKTWFDFIFDMSLLRRPKQEHFIVKILIKVH